MEDRRIEGYVKRHHPELSEAEKTEAIRVAKTAYQNNVTLHEAGEIGVQCVKDKRKNG